MSSISFFPKWLCIGGELKLNVLIETENIGRGGGPFNCFISLVSFKDV